MKKMKIMVFDDNQIHRDAAKVQLKEHDLTIVGTYDEAQKLLTPQIPSHEKVSGILSEKFGDFNPFWSDDEKKIAEYREAKEVVIEGLTIFPSFDVVLSDLLVPASKQALGPDGLKFAGEEMPIGIFIALLAAARGRIRNVAVLTDSDHHSHPASACFDAFNRSENEPTPFILNGCKVFFSNTRNWIDRFNPSNLCEESEREDAVRAKNWLKLLNYLLSEKNY